MHTAAISISVIILNRVVCYLGIDALKANNSSAVAVFGEGVICVRRGVAVIDDCVVIFEKIIVDDRFYMHRRIGGIIRIYRIAIDIESAGFSGQIIDDSVFSDGRLGQIIADNSAAAAIPINLIETPRN